MDWLVAGVGPKNYHGQVFILYVSSQSGPLVLASPPNLIQIRHILGLLHYRKTICALISNQAQLSTIDIIGSTSEIL